MPEHPLRCAAKLAVAFALCATVSVAHGEVYKCTDAGGKTTYSDVPCDSTGKTLKLPDDGKAIAAGPHLCAQLQDETRRLAAEADRDAKRGRTESADNAKRRLALTKRYEERCVGIARSEPKPK